MANKTPLADPIFVNARVGLAVMEIQTMHFGHVALLSWMRETCSRRILAIGSCDAARTPGHPFDFNQRKAMVEAVFGAGTFTFIPLSDIDATSPGDWMSYVSEKINALRLPRPTDYFAGSPLDARWYEEAFASIQGPGETWGPGRVWFDQPGGRSIRILDRESGKYPSARQIRDLIEMRDPEWRRYVPEILWAYVDWHYPPELRMTVRGDAPPDHRGHPVGTRFLPTGSDATGLLSLRDDGQWRPVRSAPDEKTRYAQASAARRPQ